MSEVELGPYLNRGRNTNNFLQGLIESQDQKTQQQELEAKQQEIANRQRAAMYLQQIQQLRPDQQASAFAQLPDDVKQYFLDQSRIAPHQPTPDEQLQQKATQDSLSTFDTLPQAVRQQGTFQTVYKAPMPSESVKMTDANDVYSHPNSFAPQMQTRQGIEDKTLLDAQQQQLATQNQRDYQTIELPKSKADIAHVGAQTYEQNQAGKNQAAQAGEHNAKATQVTKFGADPDTGAPNPVVQRWVDAAKGAAANGTDPTVVLKQITDKTLRQAVSNELAKPENVATIQKGPLGQTAKTAIAEIDPLIAQADKVIAAYAPVKNANGLMDRHPVTYLEYRSGTKTDDGTPQAQLANMQMLGVQAGSRLLKGGSRAYPALRMAMQHAPNGLTDTDAQIYDKAVKLKTQLQAAKDAQLRLGGSVTGDGAPSAGRITTPDGKNWRKNPDGSMTEVP